MWQRICDNGAEHTVGQHRLWCCPLSVCSTAVPVSISAFRALHRQTDSVGQHCEPPTARRPRAAPVRCFDRVGCTTGLLHSCNVLCSSLHQPEQPAAHREVLLRPAAQQAPAPEQAEDAAARLQAAMFESLKNSRGHMYPTCTVSYMYPALKRSGAAFLTTACCFGLHLQISQP